MTLAESILISAAIAYFVTVLVYIYEYRKHLWFRFSNAHVKYKKIVYTWEYTPEDAMDICITIVNGRCYIATYDAYWNGTKRYYEETHDFELRSILKRIMGFTPGYKLVRPRQVEFMTVTN